MLRSLAAIVKEIFMNKAKLIIPLLVVAPVIFACGSKNSLAGTKYKHDDTVEQNFKFEDGITEQQFFSGTGLFPTVPVKAEIIASIDRQLCSNSREYLGHLIFSDQPDINAGYYSLNYKEYEEGAASASAFAYKINGNNVELIESKSGGKINLWTFARGDSGQLSDYYCFDEIYIDSAKKENDRIMLNFKYIYTHMNYARTKTIKIANATFSMTYNKIN